MNRTLALISLVTLMPVLNAGEFAWQESFAEVSPRGDIALRQQAYRFEAGAVVRYIDYEQGDDTGSGSREHPWQHHPWDARAGDQVRDHSGPTTYVFKGGVTYRGALRPDQDHGEPGDPIRLTRDPSWGSGEARWYGSEPVIGWQRGAHQAMPEANQVWYADVDFHPRTLWAVDGETITRLTLARWSNWTEPEPNDPMSEWPTWEQPRWWENGNVMTVDGKERHLGIDCTRLAGLQESDIVGATVWTEWGIVMGSPYPARVEAYDPERCGVAFRGPWTYAMSEKIITGNRYYLEDKPQWLDENGEFWVERNGDGARIYLRLPDGGDPNAAQIEAGRHTALLKSDGLYHIEVSGLTFRFTNIHWEYDIPQWAHDHLRDAVIRLAGGGDDITIRHNRFEHVMMPIRISASAQGWPYAGTPIGSVRVNDNRIRHTDHGAIIIAGHAGKDDKRVDEGPLTYAEVLRNDLFHIGWRNLSGAHGHAIDIRFPKESLTAGNVLHRIAGWGIAVFGGKANGMKYTAPLSRHIIAQNRVEDVLLKSNDWGGIETWQGGSHYVYNNLVINARGFKNWVFAQGKDDKIPSFGHAYYLDGSYKNYLFNNIGLGRNNQPGHPDANLSAIQNIHSFENYFAQNTFYRFGVGTRQQNPRAGRYRYLGNLFEDISQLVFRNADPEDAEPDPNADHYDQEGDFAYGSMAYAGNLFRNLGGDFGVFEETGVVYPDQAGMDEALSRARTQASDCGFSSDDPVLADPAAGDLAPRGAALGQGVQIFVPWALSAVVGEWKFHPHPRRPGEVIDEHWYMLPYYDDRTTYHDTPRYPLVGSGIDADSHVDSPLEDWTTGAVALDGAEQYYRIAHQDLVAPFTVGETEWPGSARATVDIHESNLLIEVHLQTADDDGLVVGKRDGAGYALTVADGRLRFQVTDQDGETLSLTGTTAIADGAWHHVLVELDRATGMQLYIDGDIAAANSSGNIPAGSLANDADFLVGGGPDQSHLAVSLAYLRVAHHTLAEAATSIEELYAWQFDGPVHRDFSGAPITGRRAIGALQPRRQVMLLLQPPALADCHEAEIEASIRVGSGPERELIEGGWCFSQLIQEAEHLICFVPIPTVLAADN